LLTFYSGWPLILLLPIWTSQVAGITCVKHYPQLSVLLFVCNDVIKMGSHTQNGNNGKILGPWIWVADPTLELLSSKFSTKRYP
jgi:hypothetical protein